MATWTKAQETAIDSRGSNLLLSAGAGAGKTAVLVERIIRRVLDEHAPLDVDRLLVVTFTNAAAAEMRERVAAALHKELRTRPDCARLMRQITFLGRASITTLHSFCLEILRQNFYMLGLDPSFRVADTAECALMQTDALEQLLEESYRQLDPAFLALVEGFGGRNSDEGLQRLITDVANFALSQPEPRQWLHDAVSKFALSPGTEVNDLPWFGDVCRLVRRELVDARDMLTRALALATAGPTHYVDVLAREEQALAELCVGEFTTWDELRSRVTGVIFARLPTKRGYDKPDKDECQSLRDHAKKIIRGLAAGYLAQSATEIMAGLRLVHPQMERLVQLTTTYLDIYAQAKYAKGIVDFSDLEHMTLAILREGHAPSSVAKELQRRFEEVLVDEYQDINAVQETILRAVTRSTNAVMVGDVKQSIYRFRLADPSLFRSKEQEFNQNGSAGQCLYLAHNFRSRSGIIAAVNFVFGQLMTQTAIGEVDYDSRAELIAAASYPAQPVGASPEVEVCVLDRKAVDTEEGELDVTTREARLIAERIVSLVEGEDFSVWDVSANAYRPVEFRDIVVLLRAAAGRAETFLDVLGELNIPVYAETVGGYFRSTEVHVLMSLLKIVDNPRQDIPLAGVLRSPLVGCSATELAEIRLAHVGSYWDAVLANAAANAKLAAFRLKLEQWRDMARRGGLPELLQQIYHDTGYYLYVGTLPGGRQRQANLRALIDRAHQFESTAYTGLFRFLRFVERLEEQQGDLGKPNTSGENDNVVRVMSVHKSKGLEFPVVFVAGLGNKFNLRDLSGHVLLHKGIGLGPKVVDREARCIYPSLPHLCLRDVLRRESLSEELRVLYVALTRAREKLYLVGSVNKRDAAVAAWQNARSDASFGPLPALLVERAQNYFDWLGPALVAHTSMGGTAQGAPLLAISPVRVGFTESHGGNIDRPASALLTAVAELRPLPEGEYSQEVMRRLGYRYPHSASTQLPAKMSVSEVKRRQMSEGEEAPAPDKHALRRVRQQVIHVATALTAAEIGTAMHMLMQHVDLSAALTASYFAALREQMVGDHLLTQSEAESFSLAPIATFFASRIGKRLLAAKRVWRELPFSWRVAARELDQSVSDEFVYVQGVIDCLFSEGDSLILIDYKSDRVTDESVASACERYRSQVNLYTRAVEALFKRDVAERHIYFFALGRAVEL